MGGIKLLVLERRELWDPLWLTFLGSQVPSVTRCWKIIMEPRDMAQWVQGSPHKHEDRRWVPCHLDYSPAMMVSIHTLGTGSGKDAETDGSWELKENSTFSDRVV